MKDKIIYWLKLLLLIWPPVVGYSFVFLLTWVRLLYIDLYKEKLL